MEIAGGLWVRSHVLSVRDHRFRNGPDGAAGHLAAAW